MHAVTIAAKPYMYFEVSDSRDFVSFRVSGLLLYMSCDLPGTPGERVAPRRNHVDNVG